MYSRGYSVSVNKCFRFSRPKKVSSVFSLTAGKVNRAIPEVRIDLLGEKQFIFASRRHSGSYGGKAITVQADFATNVPHYFLF